MSTAGMYVTRGERIGRGARDEHRKIREHVARAQAADDVFQRQLAEKQRDRHGDKHQTTGAARFFKAEQNERKDNPPNARFAERSDDGEDRIGYGVMKVRLYKGHDGGVKRRDAGKTHLSKPPML